MTRRVLRQTGVHSLSPSECSEKRLVESDNELSAPIVKRDTEFVWLGIAAGIVAAGVAVMMGMFIVYGGEILIHRSNWELARVLIPTITSVLGWLITIWWAFRQFKLISEENRNLSYEMLRSNDRLKVIDALIEQLAGLKTALHEVSVRTGRFGMNLRLQEEEGHPADLRTILKDSGDAYNELFRAIQDTQIQLVRLHQFNIPTEKTTEVFSSIYALLNGRDSKWGQFQLTASSMIQDQLVDNDDLVNLAEEIRSCAEELSNSITVIVRDFPGDNSF